MKAKGATDANEMVKCLNVSFDRMDYLVHCPEYGKSRSEADH